MNAAVRISMKFIPLATMPKKIKWQNWWMNSKKEIKVIKKLAEPRKVLMRELINILLGKILEFTDLKWS
jgi:hypothetical protein